jgi:predicted ester cyclase
MKKNIWIFVLALLACSLMMASIASARNMHSEDVDPAVIDRWLEMYNRADVSQADEILAPDFIPHMPALLGIVDRASYLAKVVTPGVQYTHITLQDLFGGDDMLVGRFTITAVWPSTRPYINTAIVFFRFKNGQIAEEWWDLDFRGVLEQVGQLPPTRATYEWSSPSLATGEPGRPQQNATLAHFAIQAINTQNFLLLDHIFSANYVYHNVVVPYAHDRVSNKAFMKTMFIAFPDQRLTIEDIVVSGDRVAVRSTITGTQLGPFGALPATGRHVRYTSTTIFRIADGRIVEWWDSFDALALMKQLTAP